MYLALYRKFRPTTFNEVVEQKHIVKTLSGQIATNRVSHAYLFTGARGTGKTTLAKIFAKAVNCLTPNNGSPCGVCQMCKTLSNQNAVDIIEIDAASNNGVGEIRSLIEKVQFAPIAAKYKVYIVDEVHMLSDSAFNALLKTLEEPPSHCIFILATTEAQKLPSTILSRCMRFDFKLLSTNSIYEHIINLFNLEGKTIEDAAAMLIATNAEGSMRDALSIAEICMSTASNTITYTEVLELIGASDKTEIISLALNALNNEPKEALLKLNSLIIQGKTLQTLCKDLTQALREMLIIKLTDDIKAASLPTEIFTSISLNLKNVDAKAILRAVEVFSSLELEFKTMSSFRAMIECAIIRLSEDVNDFSLHSLNRRICNLESKTIIVNPTKAINKQPNMPTASINHIENGAISVTPNEENQNTAGKETANFNEQARNETASNIEITEDDNTEYDSVQSSASAKNNANTAEASTKSFLLSYLRRQGAIMLHRLILDCDVEETDDTLTITTQETNLSFFKNQSYIDTILKYSSKPHKFIVKVKNQTTQQNSQVLNKARELFGDSLKVNE